ncbi:MAG: hypothetical protein JO076_09665 [Verrucomicrobia bacterium]|nr:hypothetical protein [Verrucomicrobiota bacterium]
MPKMFEPQGSATCPEDQVVRYGGDAADRVAPTSISIAASHQRGREQNVLVHTGASLILAVSAYSGSLNKPRFPSLTPFCIVNNKTGQIFTGHPKLSTRGRNQRFKTSRFLEAKRLGRWSASNFALSLGGM